MTIFKLKNNENEVFFRTNEALYTEDVVREYAIHNHLVDEGSDKPEVYVVTEEDYTKYLIKKIYDTFSNCLEEIKQSWNGKSPDAICGECYIVVYMSDIMYVLDETDPSMFDYRILEKWIDNPDKMIKILCDRITNRNSYDYNETICNYINQGLEE